MSTADLADSAAFLGVSYARFAPSFARSATDAARSATYSARSAVDFAAYADGSPADSPAQFAANCACRSAVHAVNSAGKSQDIDAWVIFEREAEIIDSSASAADLLAKPLWLGGAPEEMMEKWLRLAALLLALDSSWWVWTDWYEDRLKGFEGGRSRPLIKDLEVERVLIADEDWEKGPDHILPMLVALEEKYRRDDRDPNDSRSSEQAGPPGLGSLHDKASIARFSIDGVVDALNKYLPNDPEKQDEKDELLRKLEDLRDEIDTLIAELQTEPETVETLKQERALIFQRKLNEVIAKANWVSHTDTAVQTAFICLLMAAGAFSGISEAAIVGACLVAGPKAVKGATKMIKSAGSVFGKKASKDKDED